MIAALPMYDWPELRPLTDRLWGVIRDRLRRAGLAAPDALSRGGALEALWLSPDLLLAQTCGLPFVRRLAGRVGLVGTPDFQVPGCLPGYYRSAIVVRRDDPRSTLAAFRGATLAYNDVLSQSGLYAVLHHVAPLAEDGRFFGGWLCTGSHATAAAAVARGAADLAGLDYVSWRLIRRFRPEAARLRVLMLSDPAPGLPYICAATADAAVIRAAVGEALAALPADLGARLGLGGLVALEPGDYAVIARRADAAEARLALPA